MPSILEFTSRNKFLSGVVAASLVLGLLHVSGILTFQMISENTQGMASTMMSQIKDNREWLKNNKIQGVAYIVVMDFVFIVCGFFPGAFFLEGLSGYVFGLFLGVATILSAKIMASGACFYLGKTVLSSWVRSMIKSYPTFKEFHAASGSDGWQLVLAARLSPLPSSVCSYGFSITNVSFRDYALATLFASGPMVVQNVYMGTLVTSLEDLGSNKGGFTKYLKMALPLVGTVAFVVWTKRFMDKLSKGGKKNKGPVSPVSSRLRPRDTPSRQRSPSARKTPDTSDTPKKSPRQRTPSRSRAKSPAAKSPRARTPRSRAKAE